MHKLIDCWSCNVSMVYPIHNTYSCLIFNRLIFIQIFRSFISQEGIINVLISFQIRIHKFLERRRTHRMKISVGGHNHEASVKEKEMLRKRVKSLLRRKRLVEVQNLVKDEEMKPWGRDTQAKVVFL